MTSKLIVVVMLFAVTALAVTTPASFNTRPVVIGTPAGSEGSLQGILNGIYGCTGCVNAATDQTQTAMWQEFPNNTISPQLKATYAADGDTIGMYSAEGSLVPIFNGGAAANGDVASIYFNNDGTITVGSIHEAAPGDINTGTFSGINQMFFGFYLQDFSKQDRPIYYTSDNLNPVATPAFNAGTQHPTPYTTQARAVSYDLLPTNLWAIAFEDGTDFDYNDRVISIESITASVPEPASVLLFGALVALSASRLRRRRLS